MRKICEKRIGTWGTVRKTIDMELNRKKRRLGGPAFFLRMYHKSVSSKDIFAYVFCIFYNTAILHEVGYHNTPNNDSNPGCSSKDSSN